MIFNCQTVNISEMTSLLVGLCWPGALLPPASGLNPRGWAGSFIPQGESQRLMLGTVRGLSTDQTDGQETWEGICGSSWHLCVSPPWLSPVPFPPSLSCQWEWLADIPGRIAGHSR